MPRPALTCSQRAVAAGDERRQAARPAALEVAVGDGRAEPRQPQLAAVGVPGQHQRVAVVGERPQQRALRRVGDAECRARRRGPATRS